MKLEINKSLEALNNSKILLYPTDTVWGLGCDATNPEAVANIYDIKKRKESKSLVVLVNGLKMLSKHVESVSDKVLEIINNSEKPTTIIYDNSVGLAKNVVAKDNTVAIRIVKHDFCQRLITAFGKPLVSTSANISGIPAPKSFKEIDKSILDAVDYVVNLQQELENAAPSRIVKILDDGSVTILRE